MLESFSSPIISLVLRGGERGEVGFAYVNIVEADVGAEAPNIELGLASPVPVAAAGVVPNPNNDGTLGFSLSSFFFSGSDGLLNNPSEGYLA